VAERAQDSGPNREGAVVRVTIRIRLY